MSKVLATVNGEEVLQDHVDFELQRLIRFYSEKGMPEGQIRAQLPVLQERALKQAIGARLLINEAKRLQLPVSGDELDQQFKSYVAQFGSKEKLMAALEQQGLTEESFKKELMQGRMVDKLVEKACSGIPMPTEAETEAFYNEHKDEYKTEDSVLAQHILIASNSGNKAETKKKLEAIRADIVAGKTTFADAAAAHSECPSGKSNGGSLGWFGHGMMVKEFDEVAFSIALNTVSEVFETQFGWHILLKTDEKQGHAAAFSEVRENVRDFLFHSRRGEAVEAYVEELRGKADIKIVDSGCSCGQNHGDDHDCDCGGDCSCGCSH